MRFKVLFPHAITNGRHSSRIMVFLSLLGEVFFKESLKTLHSWQARTCIKNSFHSQLSQQPKNSEIANKEKFYNHKKKQPYLALYSPTWHSWGNGIFFPLISKQSLEVARSLMQLNPLSIHAIAKMQQNIICKVFSSFLVWIKDNMQHDNEY